jgi:hypothetical protein
MTKQDEARRRAALAERTHREAKPEGQELRSAFYAAMFNAVQPAEETVSFTHAQ